MPREVLDHIRSERIGVLAVKMPDGSPHAATLHFAHNEDPLVFYFETFNTTLKAKPVLEKGSTKASLVIGVDESKMKTLQLDGEVSLIKDQLIKDIYFEKFPNKKPKYNPETNIFLFFKPTWWRFTDFKAEGGKLILTSEK